MHDAERHALRASMVTRLRQLDAQIDALGRTFEDIVEAARMSNVDDEHDPEGTTIAFERAQVAALLRDITAERSAMRDSLRDLEEGVLSCDCETCGRPIGHERLAALPSTRRCIDCAR